MKFKQKIKVFARNKYFFPGLFLLIAGMLGNLISSYYLFKNFGDTLPILHDIILDKIPYISLWWVYNLVTVISIILFLVYCYKKGLHKISYFFILIGIYQVLRAIFIILTPLGLPNGGSRGLFSQFFEYGVYPSGHTGAEFLFFLLSSGIYKKIFFVFTIIIIIALLFSRGHYTMDIFSALIFSYAIYLFGEKHIKKIIKR